MNNERRAISIFVHQHDEIQKIANDTGFKKKYISNMVIDLGLKELRKNGINISVGGNSEGSQDDIMRLIEESERATTDGKLAYKKWYSCLTGKQQSDLRYIYKEHQVLAQKADNNKMIDGF